MTKHQHYVVGFVFNADCTEVLLIEKLKPAWQKGLLNGIGGKIEPYESTPEAMNREFLEETGVDLSAHGEWIYFLQYMGDDAKVWAYMRVDEDAFQAAKTVEKEIVGRYSVNDLPSNIIPNLRWMIPLALDNIRNRWFVIAHDISSAVGNVTHETLL